MDGGLRWRAVRRMIEILGAALIAEAEVVQERAAAERVPYICAGCGWELAERLREHMTIA